MGDDAPQSKGSCLGRLVTLVAFAGLLLLGVAVAAVFRAQDLSEVDGIGPEAVGQPAPELLRRLQESVREGHPVTFTEAEINRHLRQTLAVEQGGALATRVSLDEVLVRLEDGRAEVVMVRSLMGRPFTVSMYLRVVETELPGGGERTEIQRNGGVYHERLPRPAVGGRFGVLPVPEGFLHLVLPAFGKLAAAYRDGDSLELDLVERMAEIIIEDGRLRLDPRIREVAE